MNGLRAAHGRGFLKQLQAFEADVVCLQEIKLQGEQLPEELMNPLGYQTYFNCAEKRGYSGVLVYTKVKPRKLQMKLGIEKFDEEGRMLALDFGNYVLMNLYLPHGGRRKENLDYKLNVYSRLLENLKREKRQRMVLVGDFNVAHTEIDLARPRSNKDNVMFTFDGLIENVTVIIRVVGLWRQHLALPFCTGNINFWTCVILRQMVCAAELSSTVGTTEW